MPRDNLKLLNVSGRNNNCFFNSLYVVVKNNETFKQLFVGAANGNKIRNGAQLRKYICEFLIHRGHNKFRGYLVMAKSLLTAYSNDKTELLKMHDKLMDVAQMLSVNKIEVVSLIEADILTTNVATKDGIQSLLVKHLPTTDRMPSMPEFALSIQMIKDVFNIIVLPIVLQRRMRQDERPRSINLINKYNYGKKRMATGDAILRSMKMDIKDANVVNKIRERVGNKFEEMNKKKGSSRMYNKASEYTFAVLITDQAHYQVLSLNGMSALKYVPSNYDDLSMFIFSSENSFSFSQESIRSPPTYAEGLKM
jgi:hypothetical protein